MMARDYIAIPASSCLSEWSFSMSGHTDRDPTHQQIEANKFAGLQRLKAAYQDGQLNATKEAWMQTLISIVLLTQRVNRYTS